MNDEHTPSGGMKAAGGSENNAVASAAERCQSLAGSVVFFDLGDTLATMILSPGRHRIERMRVYDYVPGVLTMLRDAQVRLGIISNRGPIPEADVLSAMADAGLLPFFEPGLIVFGAKDSPRIFELAAERAGELETDQQLMFVGEDATERAHVLQADLGVCPHPLLVIPVLHGAGLRYLRIRVREALSRWRDLLRALPLVPLHVTSQNPSTIYAIATDQVATRLDDSGFWVDRLGRVDEPQATDLYLLRDDLQPGANDRQSAGNASDVFRRPVEAQRILTSTAEGIFIALPAGRSIESLHFRQARHGHNLLLAPSITLLESLEDGANPRLAETEAAAMFAVTLAPAPLALSQQEKTILRHSVTPTQLARHIVRYTGGQLSGPGGAFIRSRHIAHPGNLQAVETLVRDLQQIGGGQFVVSRHHFTYSGRPLDNVEAELPGNGRAGVVLITAHLDSTAGRQPGYQASSDPAPGADDDGSGIAAALLAARAIRTLASGLAMPRRAIRFVFFNAEEQGLVGSRAYTRDLAAAGVRVAGACQIDMIGYDVQPQRNFELHAGYAASATVQARSLLLSQAIAAAAPQISPALPSPQVYPAGAAADPADGRSDHHSFQQQGYAACAITEDFFVGPAGTSPAPEPNPQYHLPGDTFVNFKYATDIARAAIAAAWLLATR